MMSGDESLIFSTPQRVPLSHSGNRPLTMDSPNLSPIVSDIHPSPHRPYSSSSLIGNNSTSVSSSARRLQQQSRLLPGIAEETSNSVDGSDSNGQMNSHIGMKGKLRTIIGSLPPGTLSHENRVGSDLPYFPQEESPVLSNPAVTIPLGDDFGMKSLSIREMAKGSIYSRDFPIVIGGSLEHEHSLNSVSLLDEFNGEEIPHHSVHQSLLEDSMPRNHQKNRVHDANVCHSSQKSGANKVLPSYPLSDTDDDREHLDHYYHHMKRRENQKLIEDVKKRWAKYVINTSTPIRSVDSTPSIAANGHIATPLKRSDPPVNLVSPLHDPSLSVKISEEFSEVRKDDSAAEVTKADLKNIRIALYPTTEIRKSSKPVRVVYDMDEHDQVSDNSNQEKSHVASESEDETEERFSDSSKSSPHRNASKSMLPVGSMYALILDRYKNPVLVPVLGHKEKLQLSNILDSENQSMRPGKHHSSPSPEDVEGSDDEMSLIYYGENSTLPKNRKKRFSSSSTFKTNVDDRPHRTQTKASLGLDSILDTDISYLAGVNPKNIKHPITDSKRVKFDSFHRDNNSNFLGDDDATSLQSISFISRPSRSIVISANNHLVQDRFHYFPIAPAESVSGNKHSNHVQLSGTSHEYEQPKNMGLYPISRPSIQFPAAQDHSAYTSANMLSRFPWTSLDTEILIPSESLPSPFEIGKVSSLSANSELGSSVVMQGTGEGLFTPVSTIIGSRAVGKNAGSNTKAWRSKLMKRDMTSVLNSPHISKY